MTRPGGGGGSKTVELYTPLFDFLIYLYTYKQYSDEPNLNHSQRTHLKISFHRFISASQTSRPKKSTQDSNGVFSPVTKRDYCAQELVETEKNYVDALNMIHKNFFLPLRGFVPKEDRYAKVAVSFLCAIGCCSCNCRLDSCQNCSCCRRFFLVAYLSSSIPIHFSLFQ